MARYYRHAHCSPRISYQVSAVGASRRDHSLAMLKLCAKPSETTLIRRIVTSVLQMSTAKRYFLSDNSACFAGIIS